MLVFGSTVQRVRRPRRYRTPSQRSSCALGAFEPASRLPRPPDESEDGSIAVTPALAADPTLSQARIALRGSRSTPPTPLHTRARLPWAPVRCEEGLSGHRNFGGALLRRGRPRRDGGRGGGSSYWEPPTRKGGATAPPSLGFRPNRPVPRVTARLVGVKRHRYSI